MNTKETILAKLEIGSISTKELLAALIKQKSITKQAFYKTLRDLRKEEKITIHGKRVSLSLAWITQEQNRLEKIAQTYGVATSNNFFISAQKTKYLFKTLGELDVFLSHLFLSLFPRTNGPVFFYNAHEWYSYGRTHTNDILIETARKINRPICITVTQATTLDRALLKSLNQKPLQYYLSPKTIFPEAYNIYGEYVVKIQMDPKIAALLEGWFAKHAMFSEVAQKEIAILMQKPGKHTVLLQKNAILAQKIIKKLEKYFVF